MNALSCYCSTMNLKSVNEYLRGKFGSKAELVENAVGRFDFIHVHPMRHYAYSFKSIEKAVNCLKTHLGENNRPKKKSSQATLPTTAKALYELLELSDVKIEAIKAMVALEQGFSLNEEKVGNKILKIA